MKIFCFFLENDRLIGLPAGEDGKKVLIKCLDAEGKESEIAINTNRLFEIECSEELKLEDLNDLKKSGEEKSKELDLESCWQHFTKKSSLQDGDIISFLKIDTNTINKLAVYYAVLNDGVYFKVKNGAFHRRSEKEVNERLAQKSLFSEHVENLAKLNDLFESNTLTPETIQADVGLEKLVQNIKLLAAGSIHLETEKQKLTLKAVNELRKTINFENLGSNEKNAYELLVRLGILKQGDSLLFEKYGLEQKAHVHSASKNLAANYTKLLEKNHKRKDLTNLEVYTIDDTSTKDMDDAISLVRKDEGFSLGIHISDVAALVEKNSPLDKIAKERATSIYTTEQILNMLPDEASENLASLVPGEVRPALSIILDVSQDFKITNHKIISSLIKVTEKLSYKDALEKIDREDDWMMNLYQISVEHQTERELNGANSMHRTSFDVRVDDDNKLYLKDVSQSDFARSTIAELMVMANRFFAEYAAKNFLPAFFRCQDATTENSVKRFSPTYDYLTAKPHSSLALNAYLQATSPIRRYRDLCNQRQISQHIQDKSAAYERKELQKLSKLTANPLKTANLINKDAKRYWLLKYISEQEENIFAAEVIHNEKKKGLIEFKDSLFKTLIALPDSMKAGDQIKVKVLSVRPEFLEIQTELIV